MKGSKKKRVLFSDRKRRGNPPAGGVEIYHRVGGIYAQKGPGHACDPKCKKAGHWYEHRFTAKVPVIGLPNGRLLI